MEVQRAKGCPECETAATISKQDDWLTRVLNALRIDIKWFILALVAVWWIFLLSKVPPMVSGVDTAIMVLGWALLGVFCGLFAVVSTVVTLLFLWLPSYIRCYLIGWPMTMEVVDGCLHRHLGHKSKTGRALFTRHYGPWRKTVGYGPSEWQVIHEARGCITLGSNTWLTRKERWLLTVDRDMAAVLVCELPSLHHLPTLALRGERVQEFLQRLGTRLAEHHQAVAEDKAGLGFTPRGQAMRQWLRELAGWAHQEAENLSTPFSNVTGNPLSPAVNLINEHEGKIEARRRKKHRPEARPEAVTS